MDNQKLAIIILGNRNSGKSNTFYELFGRTIKTGWKQLQIDGKNLTLFVKNSSFEEMGEVIDKEVFVRNSSFEERKEEADKFFDKVGLPRIVLCAVQYKEKGLDTIEFFKRNGYYIYIQWLNPGFRDNIEYEDFLKFEERFSSSGQFHKVSGKEKTKRVEQIKQFLIGWMLNKDIQDCSLYISYGPIQDCSLYISYGPTPRKTPSPMFGLKNESRGGIFCG